MAILASRSIALVEYAFQVPVNRIGFGTLSLPQLKILQEVVTLSLLVSFAVFYIRTPVGWNFLWSGICLAGAVYFNFHSP